MHICHVTNLSSVCAALKPSREKLFELLLLHCFCWRKYEVIDIGKQPVPSVFNLIHHVFHRSKADFFKSLTSLFYTLIETGIHPQNCFQWTTLSLSVLVSLQRRDGCLWGALNEPLIRLIRQQIECGDVFGLQVVPRAPLPLWSLYGTRAVKPFVARRRSW